jgi:hypothetical protein
MSRFAQAIEQSRVDVVPKILIGGGGGDGHNGGPGGGGAMSGNIMEAQLAMLLSDRLGTDPAGNGAPSSLPRNPSADILRRRIQQDLDTPKG